MERYAVFFTLWRTSEASELAREASSRGIQRTTRHPKLPIIQRTCDLILWRAPILSKSP